MQDLKRGDREVAYGKGIPDSHGKVNQAVWQYRIFLAGFEPAPHFAVELFGLVGTAYKRSGSNT